MPWWLTCHCPGQRPRPGYLRLAESEAHCGPWGRPGSTYYSPAAGTCPSPRHTQAVAHTNSSDLITKTCNTYFLKLKTLQKSSPLKVTCLLSLGFKVYLPVCVHTSVCVSLNKLSDLKKRGWEMKGYWKRDEALTLSLFCRFTLNTTTAERGKGFTTLLSSLHSPLIPPSFDTHFRRLGAMANFYCSLSLLHPNLLIHIPGFLQANPSSLTTTNPLFYTQNKTYKTHIYFVTTLSSSPLPRCPRCLGCHSCSRTAVGCSC